MSAQRRLDEVAANQVIREAVRDVLLVEEPVRINTRVMAGPVLRWVLSQCQHAHALTGQCLVRRDGQRCEDEFDWWKPEAH